MAQANGSGENCGQGGWTPMEMAGIDNQSFQVSLLNECNPSRQSRLGLNY
jgi:hypothetical protein